MDYCFVKLNEFSEGKFFPEDTQYDIQVVTEDKKLLVIPITEESEVPNGYELMLVTDRNNLEALNFKDWGDFISLRNRPVPSEVTPRQIRLALTLNGIKISDISAMLGTLPEPQGSLAMIEWEYATTVERSNVMVNSMGQALGMTKEQLDDLFIFARTL
jgi:hypothetical protein